MQMCVYIFNLLIILIKERFIYQFKFNMDSHLICRIRSPLKQLSKSRLYGENNGRLNLVKSNKNILFKDNENSKGNIEDYYKANKIRIKSSDLLVSSLQKTTHKQYQNIIFWNGPSKYGRKNQMESSTEKKQYSDKINCSLAAAIRMKNRCSFLNHNMMTPKKQKVFDTRKQPKKQNSNQKNKFLKNLNQIRQVETIEAKGANGQSTSVRFEESELIFKGSRDVPNINPLRLIYDEDSNQIQKSQMKISSQQATFQFHSIKSSHKTILARQLKSNAILSLLKLDKNQDLLKIEHPEIIEIWHIFQNQNEGKKYLLFQPYEYTVKQLITMRKITEKNYQKLMNSLKNAIQCILQNLGNNLNLELFEEQIQQNIYYIHGKFKILPIFRIKQIKNASRIINKVNKQIKAQILKKQ